LLLVVGHTLAIYVCLVVAVGRLGRSLMAGLTHFDYLVVALLGSAIETGLYCASDSLWAGVASAATLIAANRATCFAMNRWPRLRRLFAGAPVVLVHDGPVIREHLRRVRLSEEGLRAAVRRRGFDDLEKVHLAVLDLNGEVGVVPMIPDDGR
jgi:uncharacterized membrane protein YcaP (DUF421 family)